MRVLALLCFCAVAFAQDWKRELMGLPDQPSGASAQDIDRFVQNVQLATPYFATITPGDFEANREMVRRMWAYTMALEMMAKQNAMLRPMARRARNAMNAFPIGYNMMLPQQAPPRAGAAKAAVAPPKPAGPPFPVTAPPIEGLPDDLGSRYASTAVRGATAWQNAEIMRQSLASKGMSLNAATGSALGRLQADMDSALRSMQSRNWTEAGSALDRADAEIEKISKVVGH
jgi:hypothetical protein